MGEEPNHMTASVSIDKRRLGFLKSARLYFKLAVRRADKEGVIDSERMLFISFI